MFMVKANPIGLTYKDEGSAVVGCYSPTSGVSIVKEFSGIVMIEEKKITLLAVLERKELMATGMVTGTATGTAMAMEREREWQWQR